MVVQWRHVKGCVSGGGDMAMRRRCFFGALLVNVLRWKSGSKISSSQRKGFDMGSYQNETSTFLQHEPNTE